MSEILQILENENFFNNTIKYNINRRNCKIFIYLDFSEAPLTASKSKDLKTFLFELSNIQMSFKSSDDKLFKESGVKVADKSPISSKLIPNNSNAAENIQKINTPSFNKQQNITKIQTKTKENCLQLDLEENKIETKAYKLKAKNRSKSKDKTQKPPLSTSLAMKYRSPSPIISKTRSKLNTNQNQPVKMIANPFITPSKEKKEKENLVKWIP
jgi:hypothetical protein